MAGYESATLDIDGYVPFSEERCRQYIEDGHWRNLTFHDVLDRAADDQPDRTAVIGPHRELSYGDLQTRSRQLAAALVENLGLEVGDMAVFQFPNCTEFVEAFFACSRAGVVPVMLLPRHRAAEATHVTNLTDAKAFFTAGDRYEMGFDHVGLVDDIAADCDSLEHRVAVCDETVPDGWHSFDDLFEPDGTDAADDIEVNPFDPGLMLLSGGTTGMPKGIPRTHNDYVFQWEYMASVSEVEDDWVSFPSVPIGHNASLNCIVGATFWAGGTLAVEPNLKPESLMALIERVGGNYTLPIPTQLIDILEHPKLDEYDLSSLEVVMSGGQKVRPKAVYDFVDNWDVGFENIFGMAEGPLICTRPDDDVDVQAHTVGRPIAPDADEVKIVDERREEEVQQGEAGELAVRGPGFFTGYFRNEEENSENFDEDGWFYTEDVLRLNDDGNFEVFGRMKDTIIRGGENIYAPGIEDEIIEHPSVMNVAVIGMPDERLGERPCAFIELEPDAEAVTVDSLSTFLDERGIAVFKHPERVEIVDEIPRTEVGKIAKVSLEERITQQLKSEGVLPEEY
ncbi:(2,3-dihydroxybenzoyl)adenylate synthase [Haloarchaeobius litoreus]|uniref:(2,3-dihydroxybenzoyl)adenylate synthase n=1 Tax=Haloarchaeobius litoreus TaxID=755306 RepID=A0ABD6DNA3_9EURY|nr:AMP-binding protein [Haloarchaeobius litoreus]